MTDGSTATDGLAFLSGGGEMGALIRSHDWAGSPLGAPGTWPGPLRTALRLILNTGHPMYVWWGPELLCFYNDAYRASIGPERHPSSLGQPAREVWAEIWPIIGPQIARVMEGGASTWAENALVPITRHGRREDVYWTYSYGPIDDERAPSGVGGVLVVCSETTAQVQAARSQAAERARLARMFEQAPGFMALLEGPEHVFELVNAAYLQLVGHRNVLGLPVREAVPEVEGQGFFELLDRVYATGEAFVGQAVPIVLQRTPGASPEERILDFVYQPVIDEHGTVTGIFAEGSDVTDRARQDAALRESEARFHQMADAVPQIVWIADAEGRVEYFNRQWYDYTGALREDLDVAAVAAGYIHPEDGPAAVAAFTASKETGGSFAVEHRIRSTQGEWRWFLVRGEPVLDPATGKVLRFFGASVDIHDRKVAEEALRTLNLTLEARVAERTAALTLYRNVVDSDRFPICTYDPEHRVTGFNTAHADDFLRVMGRPACLGEVLPDLFPPEQAAALRAFIDRALGGETFTVEAEFGNPDFKVPHWELDFAPVRDEAGAIIGAFHHARDVTARLKAEADLTASQEALRQSQKMEAMGQLTGGVAHDFNNLLTPIIGSLDRLVNRGLGSEREQRLIAGALESAERAKTLVQRLLAFARRQPLQAVAVDLGALVDGIAGLVGSTIGPTIEVRVELAGDLPPARADPNQLEMALLNLAVNARDAMPRGGRLTIAAAREDVRRGQQAGLRQGPYVRLSVADTGLGMDEATLARAVEPFFSTKGVGKGTGLGLSMVHGLAAQLGGGLTIDSAPGQGTTVALWLPISAEPVGAVEAIPAASPQVQARGRALLVDDEDLVRMSTADMLADMGFDVLEAGSAEEALRLLHEGTDIDLLVTDHLMPGVSGADLAREARALRPGPPVLPVLIVSGYAEVDGLTPDLPRLVKPFRAAELAERVAAIMPRAASAE